MLSFVRSLAYRLRKRRVDRGFGCEMDRGLLVSIADAVIVVVWCCKSLRGGASRSRVVIFKA